MQEALQLLISGQLTTEASVKAAVSLAAAADIGRSKAGKAGLEDLDTLEGIVDGMGSLGFLPPSQVLALVEENQSLRDQVQALRSVILDLTEKPMGPSREAEKDLHLWSSERDLRLSEGSSRISLAFGTPPLFYVPRSQEEDEARHIRGDTIPKAPLHQLAPVMGLEWNHDRDDDMDFED